MKPLDGRVAIVTGGASGIGAATAVAMARAGARIAIGDVNVEGAEVVVAAIREFGGDALARRTDVADPADLDGLVKATVARFGRIDVLDNNAADLSLLAADRDLLETDLATWERTYRSNQQSVMVASRLVLPYMLRQGSGSIINISSVDSLSGETTRFAYGMSKAAINLLTLCIATTYGRRGIRCNAILPGLVMTPMAKANVGVAERAVWEANIPSPFLADPDHIASVAVFLASDAAAYVNGELIRVDGGLMGHVPHLAQFRALESEHGLGSERGRSKGGE